MSRDVSRRRLLSSTGLALAAGASATAVGAARPESNPPELSVHADAGQPSFRWTETFDQSPEDGVVAATTTDDGLSVGVGATAGSDGQNPWVFAIDEHGRGQWQTPLDVDANQRFLDVAPARDGGVLVSGERRPDDGPNEAIVVRVDAEGTVQWRERVDAPSEESVAFSVIRGPDDGYVVAGGTRDADQERTSGMVVRLDADGATQWATDYPVGQLSLLWSVAPTGDGSYVGGGVVQTETDGGSRLVEGWVVGVDGDGAQAWSGTHHVERNGQPARMNYVRDVVATGDGFLGVGQALPPDANGNVAWVLATDASGARTGQAVFTPDDAAGLEGVTAYDGEYVAVGRAQSTDGQSGTLYLGVDGSASPQWNERQVIGDASQAVAAITGADGGLLTFGRSTTGGSTPENADVAVTKLGGDPRPSSAATSTGADTETATPTATPTASATPSPTATTAPPTTGPESQGASTATVTGTPSDAGEEATTSGNGPGFGLGTALGALGAGALYRLRGRTDGEDDQ